MSFFRFSKITLRSHKFFIFFNRLKLFKTFSNQSTYLEKIHSDKIFGFQFSSSILKAHSSPNQNVIKDSRILVIKKWFKNFSEYWYQKTWSMQIHTREWSMQIYAQEWNMHKSRVWNMEQEAWKGNVKHAKPCTKVKHTNS